MAFPSVKSIPPNLFPAGDSKSGQQETRCAVCLRPGPLGWLYRCTQDRELLIEDDLENGCEAPFDQLAAVFPLPVSPKKRSPSARTSSSLAFLDEISHDSFKTYTPIQVSSILRQRNQLLDVLKENESGVMMLATEGLQLSIPAESQPGRFSIFSTSPKELGSPPKKSWLPTRECQFKCCQMCRPSFHERSYLSLDAVVNGEFPATAITGFGFHYRQERPVALVKHVRNLGLRPNPVLKKKLYRGRPQRVSSLFNPLPFPQGTIVNSIQASQASPSPFNDEINADTTFGQVSNAYDSTAMTRSLNAETGPFSHTIGSSFGADVQKAFQEIMILRRQGADMKGVNKFDIGQDAHKTVVRPPWTPPNSPCAEKNKSPVERKVSENETPGSNGRSDQSLKTDHNLRNRFNLNEYHEDGDVGLFLALNDALLSRACAIALPVETSDEQLA